MSAAASGSDATSIGLRNDIFDALAAKQGANSETERARLVEVDRTTLYRIRERKVTPSLDVAYRMARVLGTTVDELFEQVSA